MVDRELLTSERFQPPENPDVETQREYTCIHHPKRKIMQRWRIFKRGPNPGGIWVPQFCDECITGQAHYAEEVAQENRNEVRQTFIATSGLPDSYRGGLFHIDSFPPQTVDERDQISAFKAWVTQAEQKRILYAYGDNGVGKTHLAMSAVMLAAKAGHRAKYWTLTELLYASRDAMKNDAEKEFLDMVSDAEYLAIDEVGGSEKQGEYTVRVLTYVIDKRYRNGRPTLVVSNYSPVKLATRLCPDDATSDPTEVMRLMDRLTDTRQSVVLQMKGKSHRQVSEQIGGRRTR